MIGIPVLSPLRGWGISPDALALVLADIQRRTRPVVVEFGSGQPTIALAAMLEKRRLVAN